MTRRMVRQWRVSRAAGVLVVAASLGGCVSQPITRVQILVSDFEPTSGARVLLWPADDEGVEWRYVLDDPHEWSSTEVRIFSLPPADRDVPRFAWGVVNVSVLVPRAAGHRLRHRAAFVLERLGPAHPRASLCLVSTDADVDDARTVTGLFRAALRARPGMVEDDDDFERQRRPIRSFRHEDGGIFIR